MATMRDYLDRRKATRPAAEQAPQAQPSGKPAKQPKPAKRDAQPGDIITFRCGCRIGVGFLASVDCRGCSNARRKARMEARAANQDRRQQIPRLPNGSNFNVTYDAATEIWTGTLTVEGVTFQATASAVFQLLKQLDQLYRASPFATSPSWA
jgi:hypothetical protein